MCPGFSGVSVIGANVDLEPFVGKVVLVSGFRKDDPLVGSIYIEHLELDEAVNNRLMEYKKYCPFPFERMEPFVGSN
ncbi:MAG: hypothetical protein KBD73_03945 [Candidatus Magasanikbacteria bacterium]|nr:hypothetical protein [Candidatus Magasanikbacteria bacterium]